MIQDSLSFFMFIYNEPIEMITDCICSFLNTSPLGVTVIDNFPGRNFGHYYAICQFERVRIHNNLLNQSQARNWNQATRLTMLDKHKWTGIIAPDTTALAGWLDVVNEYAEKGYKLINHLNFSVFEAETIKKLGWFDERHVSGGCEDYDMYCRFEEAGIPYDRRVFCNRRVERRGNLSQYKNTEQHDRDVGYWMSKWAKGQQNNPELVMNVAAHRVRNKEDINWYPDWLDRDL